MNTRKDKLKTAKTLLENSSTRQLNITAKELAFIEKLGFCLDAFETDSEIATVFVTDKDEAEAQRIVNKLKAGTDKDVLMFVTDSDTAPK